MRKVFKYGTGHPIPDGAQYLHTEVEIAGPMRFVWHYFLVDAKE